MRYYHAIKTIVMLLTMSILLSQCGYHLRGFTAREALRATTIAIKTEQPNHEFIKTLKQHLRAADVAIVQTSEAKRILTIQKPTLSNSARAISSNTQIRTLQLTLRIDYQFANAEGQPLSPMKQLLVSKNFTTDDNQMLGASHEQRQVERAMYQEASYQLINALRRSLVEVAHAS